MELGLDPVSPTCTPPSGGSNTGLQVPWWRRHMAESSTPLAPGSPLGLGQWDAAQKWVLPLVLGRGI